ncbi:hypothetical protein EMIHUDRAFT_112701 [Emiliania huxleyi CCMP1516]|uniref:F-box domain-containing protein n=2 Tax=Emiliania huxleyi TaxID=2903 RepID=A0A0D3K7B0_EMIH1|nr:hypothetical protein EMIHUDRAFT_112701 [Emiliania huxleyi CCMP1516]EOD31645.1 hypothetical protein EMIHUDRAFT_112701 [Emiliania huxleyi CCMP1516]|eukprot:XP_005784074.1 hypothetical protein EMIHUDRAFT_112701 [Emiliania huxleyi CCMP1516]
MSRSPRARTEEAPPTDWLGELPPELHLRILEGVDDFSDCAAFSLASPRLGLLALRSGLVRFNDPLFAVAMRLLLAQRTPALRRSPRLAAAAAAPAAIPPSPLTESILRKYAADRRASADHFPWLARVSPALCLSSELDGPGDNRIANWRLQRGDESGARLRVGLLRCGFAMFFEGERGAERRVRAVSADGTVVHLKGERGAERNVRTELPDGSVAYYEGDQGVERMVRMVHADGSTVVHLEGERGAERMVRTEMPGGMVKYCEGEKGAEKMVRMELPNGNVQYYEGEQDAERVVRMESANGNVQYYEGEQGAERVVRVVLADGAVVHCEGEQGAERKVRVEFANGNVQYYDVMATAGSTPQ